jgi:hypothetical protein
MIEQSSCYVENVIVWAVMTDILAVMVYGWYRMVKDDEYTFPFKLTSHDGLHRVHPRTTVYTIPHTYDGFLFIHDGLGRAALVRRFKPLLYITLHITLILVCTPCEAHTR